MDEKEKKELMMTARVVEVDGEGFVLCFDDAAEDVGEIVTVTIIRSEVEDG